MGCHWCLPYPLLLANFVRAGLVHRYVIKLDDLRLEGLR